MLHRLPVLLLLFVGHCMAAQDWTFVRVPAVHGFTEFAESGATVYAVADFEYGVYSSQDNGASWQKRWPGFRFYVAQGKFYRIERDSVYRLLTSTDQGVSWTDEGALPVPTAQFVPYLTIAPSGDVFCYIRDILFRRRVGEATWKAIYSQPNQTLYHVHTHGQGIWLQTDTWVVYSKDDGENFTFAPFFTQQTLGMAGRGDSVVCMYQNQLFAPVFIRTVDGGQSWDYYAAPPDLVALQRGGFPCYALDYQGNWWRSSAGQGDWARVIDRVGTHNARRLLVRPSGNLIATNNGVITNISGQWRYGWHGFQDTLASKVAWLSMAGDTLLCFSGELSQTAYSTDQGITWQRGMSGWLPKPIFDLGTHYGGLHGGDFLLAEKGSQFNWQRVYHPGQVVTPFQSLGVSDTAIYAADVVGIYAAKEPGLYTLRHTPGKLPGDVMVVAKNTLFTRSDSAILASTDGGVTWKARKVFPFPIHASVSRLLSIGDHIFLSQIQERKVFHSSDGGFTFAALPIPQDAGPFFQLRVHGKMMLLNTLNPLFSFTTGSLYISNDLGQNWCDIGVPATAHLNNTYMTDVCAHDGTVYLRVNGLVWRKSCKSTIGTSEETEKAQNAYAIAPNPGHEVLRLIPLQTQPGRTTVQVVNVLGRMVYTGATEPDVSLSIATSNWPNGLYWVLINGRAIGKWAKE
jgi:hypothetical protein